MCFFALYLLTRSPPAWFPPARLLLMRAAPADRHSGASRAPSAPLLSLPSLDRCSRFSRGWRCFVQWVVSPSWGMSPSQQQHVLAAPQRSTRICQALYNEPTAEEPVLSAVPPRAPHGSQVNFSCKHTIINPPAKRAAAPRCSVEAPRLRPLLMNF